MKLSDAYEVFRRIEQEISKMEDRWDNLPDEFEFDYDDSEEKYRHDAARTITDKLGDIKSIIEWVNKPVRAEGYLQKNGNGRYELSGIELTSGYPIDAWDQNYQEWVTTRIEHSGDYYIYHLKDQEITDTVVRIK